MTDSLQPIMRPRSIAVIGASRDVDSPGHHLVENLLRGGFNGPVYPVNPHAEHIASVRAYGRIRDIPGEVDLAVIATPAIKVVEVVRDCIAKGVKGLIVVSGGFTEMGEVGAQRQKEIADLARSADIRLIGPNCLGVINTDPAISMLATFANQSPPPGNIALSAQSGAVAIHVMDQCEKRGIGLSECVTVGNKADVSGNDLLTHWAQDPRTSVIMLYLESFGNPRKFAELCRVIGHLKPIIAVKSGRTAVGGKAASSHTAALMSSDLTVDALFQQAGVLRVDTVDEMLNVARLLSMQELPKGKRVAIIGNSGGPGVMAADACEGAGLTVPPLSEQTQSELRTILGPAAAVTNPVDMTAAATAANYEAALRAVMQDDTIDAAIVIYTALPPSHARMVAKAVAATRMFSSKTLVTNFIAPDDPIDSMLQGHRIANYQTPEDAVFVLAKAAELAQWRATPLGKLRVFDDVDDAHVASIIKDSAFVGYEGWLNTTHANALVQSYGIPVVDTRHAGNADEAVKMAEDIGFPVVLKTAAMPVVHKTDVGGVKLNLQSADEVRAAYSDIQKRLGEDFNHVTVQPMAKPGVELIVGAVQDPSFGPVVVFGLGGITTEVLGDRAARLAPLTRDDAERLIRSIHGAPLLFGHRGSQPVNLDALVDLVCRLGALVNDHAEIAELDLNPVIATESGVLVVDAKVRINRSTPSRGRLQ